jgi:hypothetical protein
MHYSTINCSRRLLCFETLEPRIPLDGQPVLLNAQAVNMGPNSVEIVWQTDVPSTSQVQYHVGDEVPLTSALYATPVTEHSVVLAGLSPTTPYEVQVSSKNPTDDTSASTILDFTTAPIPCAPNSTIVTGGLTSYPVAMLGPNLLANPSFEQTTGSRPTGWTDNGFVIDGTVAHTGNNSYRLTDANTIPYAQSAWQEVSIMPGSYRIGGWIKLDGMATTSGGGVRLALGGMGSNVTSTVKGTSNWQYVEATRQVLGGQQILFDLQAYAEPNGTAWFDDMELQRELPPAVDVFMRYPNYRGILFDDQSQVVVFDVRINPPEGTNLSDYHVEATITDEASSSVVDQQTFPAAGSFTASFDGTGYINNHTYLARFQLVRNTDAVTVYEYPAYRISKLPGSIRATMATSFDQYNRFLVYGKPTFILGVYDSGLGYTTSEANWESTLTNERRLFELPINYYLNYWYGNASAPAMTSLMNVLQDHGILYLQTGNAFDDTYSPDKFLIHTDDVYAATLAAHPGFGGLYAADEPIASLADAVFKDYQRIKTIDPGGVTFGVSNRPSELEYWRDAVDILATDPYPIYGAEPAGGYPFSQVADETIATRQALLNSRPFAEVLQFFQSTNNSRWPTQNELRNMSLMAIAEGANGLFFWSLGTNALAWVESGWGPKKTELFSELKAVMDELSDLEPALVGLDAPGLLIGNDDPTDIRTRVKVDDSGVAYVIAYNYSNQTTSTTFTWHDIIPGGRVVVHGESRSIVASAASFTDTFAPNEAHVYVIAARDFVVDGVTLTINQPDAISDNTAVTIRGNGTLDLGGYTITGNLLTLESGSLSNGKLNGGCYTIFGGEVSATLGPGPIIKQTTGTATVTTPINATTVNVQAGQLTVTSIVADTLVIGAGATVVIAAIPMPGFFTSLATTSTTTQAPVEPAPVLSQVPPVAAVAVLKATVPTTSTLVGPLPATTPQPVATDAALALVDPTLPVAAAVPLVAPLSQTIAPKAAILTAADKVIVQVPTLDHLTLMLAMEQFATEISSQRHLRAIDAVLAEGALILIHSPDAFAPAAPVRRMVEIRGSGAVGKCLPVVPGHPVLRARRQFPHESIEFREVIEGIGPAEFAVVFVSNRHSMVTRLGMLCIPCCTSEAET